MSSNIHPYRYGAVEFLVPVLVNISRVTGLEIFVAFRGSTVPARGLLGPAEASPLNSDTATRIILVRPAIIRELVERDLPACPGVRRGFYTSNLSLYMHDQSTRLN